MNHSAQMVMDTSLFDSPMNPNVQMVMDISLFSMMNSSLKEPKNPSRACLLEE